MICKGVYLIGGVILVISAFIKNGRHAPTWTRILLTLSGALTILHGLLGYFLIFWRTSLPKAAQISLGRIDLQGGAAFGLILFLFLSGGLKTLSLKGATTAKT